MLRRAPWILIPLLAGCASEPTAGDSPPPPRLASPPQPAEDREAEGTAADEPASADPPARDLLARVAELEDRRAVDGAWAPLLTDADPGVRRRAAIGVGRVREPQLTELLVGLERDPVDAVEVERVFALGQIADADATATLTARLADESAPVRAAAVQALAKLGKPHLTKGIIPLLDDPESAVQVEAALALARLRGRRVEPPAPLEPDDAGRVLAKLRRLIGEEAPEGVAWRATYALANLDLPRRLTALEAALLHPSEAVRVFALRGIGRVEGEDARRLETAASGLKAGMREGQVHAATTAAQVLARLGPPAIPYLVWASAERSGAESALGERDHHLRAAALKSLAKIAEQHGDALTADDRRQTVAALTAALEAPTPIRAAALVALAQVAPQEALGPIQAAAGDDAAGDGPASAGDHAPAADDAAGDQVYARLAAAAACAHLPGADAQPLLERLRLDVDPRVVCAALGALSEHEELKAGVRQAALDALTADDLAVRTTGLSLLAEHGRASDGEAIRATVQAAKGDANAELRVEGVKALGEIGGTDDADLRAWLTERGAADPSPAVRQAAATALAKLSGEGAASAPHSADGTEPAPARPSSVALTAADAEKNAEPRLILHTTRGELVLKLFRRDAPRHVKSILERARAGLHDGLVIHRVVSAFVVQGLDPRGDGWGTGDVFLRDEINRRPYVRGALGMPNAGRDTGGCQIFVTHVPTPHLDGNYTVFGQVVEGLDVLDALAVGDRVQRAEVQE